MLACIYEIETQGRPEKYVSICFDSQVALKALQGANTLSALVQQCQKALIDISAKPRVPGHAGVRGNEISNKLAKGSSTQKVIGHLPSCRVSRQNISKDLMAVG
jgi:hypothetical protein